MKMLHANLGIVELVSELGKGQNGMTLIKHQGHEIEASTVYLKPIPDERTVDTDSRTASGS